MNAVVAPAAASRERRLVGPGKVNLTLDVFALRPDGFHGLDSLVALLLPGDDITVRRATPNDPGRPVRLSVTHAGPAHDIPMDERNLAHRAAALFLERFVPETEKTGLDVHLNKRLPAQAGLGGGSSDAAAVLRALSDLFPGAATPADLADAGAALGSDVPLFLSRSPLVRMRGRGEIVAPVRIAAFGLFGVLVRPEVGVPTGAAYALLDALPGRVPGKATGALLALLLAASKGARRRPAPGELAAALSNDFEAAILPAFPAVRDAHRQVREVGALRALLCGSGSAVFGLARDENHARSLGNRLRERGNLSWVETVHLAVEAPDAC